jgi:hypothetical protein
VLKGSIVHLWQRRERRRRAASADGGIGAVDDARRVFGHGILAIRAILEPVRVGAGIAHFLKRRRGPPICRREVQRER